MDVENAAALLELRFLLNNNNWEETTQTLPNFHNNAEMLEHLLSEANVHVENAEEAGQVYLTQDFAVTFLIEQVVKYQKTIEEQNKCPKCKYNFRRNAIDSLQCKVCSRRWCYYDDENFNSDSNCARVANGFVNKPDLDGNWKCRDCLRKDLGL